jgi:SPP1 family phage portal protein
MDLENQDIKKVFDAIKAKRNRYTILMNYYDGNQPTVYLTQRLREIFRGVDIQFIENWCSIVIDACRDRINLQGIKLEDRQAQEIIDKIWDENELGIESDDIHTTSLICGESFLLIWPTEDGKNIEAYYNDPRMVHILYDPNNPRKKLCAGKLWEDENEKARLTMYYPDHLEYYSSNKKFKDVSSWNAFEKIDEDATNQYGIVPVFHFRNNRRIISDLQNAIPLQNGSNKLLSDMMVAAEFGAFKHRWVISGAGIEGRISSKPGDVWDLPAGDGQGQGTQVGEFSATDLKNYLDAIDNLAAAIGKITATPKHYFYNQGGDPSGESLIAMEAPLNKKASERIERFIPVWKKAAEFMLMASGVSVDRSDITPLFDEPETIQPVTEANITQTRVNSGVPLVTALREEGWSESKLEQLNKDITEAKVAQTSMAAAILENIRNKDAQNNYPLNKQVNK